ncbi:MAG: VirE protein, partial [Bacteroidales bacterium]|nr:VirE protein [Bacteroidales bacterium]
MIVNIYKNVRDTKGATANLFSILTTDKWRHLSDKVRTEKDKAKRDKLKLQLPAFTPSGTFKTRNKKGLIKHSGYMCIDIDADDNPGISDWQAVVFELGKLPQVAFAGLSVSGNGVFALIPILH